MKKKDVVLLLMFLPVLWGLSFGSSSSGDVPGSRDHPVLSRYPGSIIYHYSQKEFERFYLLLESLRSSSDKALKRVKKKEVRGKVTLIQYQIPRKRSSLEVFENYREALKKSGFKFLYTGSGEEISGIRSFLDRYCGFWNVFIVRDRPENYYYLAAESPDKQIAVTVFVGEKFEGPVAFVGIVERKSMETGLITAKDMLQHLKSEGHVSLYGIYFDFDSAEIRPESEPVLREIARLLRENPSLKLYVVGHTDNVGKLQYNLQLSKRRAQAVVEELVRRYGIERTRLKAFGVGPLAPVASNKTPEGRAKNRRVELVEQ